MRMISIDPGANGAAVVWWDSNAAVKTYAGKGWATGLIANMLNLSANYIVFIEKAQAMPRQGVSSMFRYGQSYGELLGACAAVGMPVVQVSPQTWQKYAYRGISGEGKARSFEACKRLLPHHNLVLSGCRKPHDGLADALLIGLWAISEHSKAGAK